MRPPKASSMTPPQKRLRQRPVACTEVWGPTSGWASPCAPTHHRHPPPPRANPRPAAIQVQSVPDDVYGLALYALDHAFSPNQPTNTIDFNLTTSPYVTSRELAAGQGPGACTPMQCWRAKGCNNCSSSGPSIADDAAERVCGHGTAQHTSAPNPSLLGPTVRGPCHHGVAQRGVFWVQGPSTRRCSTARGACCEGLRATCTTWPRTCPTSWMSCAPCAGGGWVGGWVKGVAGEGACRARRRARAT